MVLPTLKFEKSFWEKGFKLVCGIDEVGRGSFAGPVVAGAVIYPPDVIFIEGVRDSKLLNSKQREKLDLIIKEQAISWAVAEISVSAINKFGIGKATQMAFRKVVKQLRENPDYILIDAFYIKHFKKKKQLAIKKGDKLSFSIASASIIAKVHRYKLMAKLAEKYPQYNLEKHKGYGTTDHRDKIKKYGLSKIHRKSFNLEKFLI